MAARRQVRAETGNRTVAVKLAALPALDPVARR